MSHLRVFLIFILNIGIQFDFRQWLPVINILFLKSHLYNIQFEQLSSKVEELDFKRQSLEHLADTSCI